MYVDMIETISIHVLWYYAGLDSAASAHDSHYFSGMKTMDSSTLG